VTKEKDSPTVRFVGKPPVRTAPKGGKYAALRQLLAEQPGRWALVWDEPCDGVSEARTVAQRFRAAGTSHGFEVKVRAADGRVRVFASLPEGAPPQGVAKLGSWSLCQWVEDIPAPRTGPPPRTVYYEAFEDLKANPGAWAEVDSEEYALGVRSPRLESVRRSLVKLGVEVVVRALPSEGRRVLYARYPEKTNT